MASNAACKPLVLAIDKAPSAIAVAFPTLVTGPVKFAFVVTVAALPAMLPVTLEPATVTIFASVTDASASLVVVIAPAATDGDSAVPVRSPANCTFPFTVVVASGVVLLTICPST